MSRGSDVRRAHFAALDAQVFDDAEWEPCEKCGGTGFVGGKTQQANDIEWPCSECTRYLRDAGPLTGHLALGCRPGWVPASETAAQQFRASQAAIADQPCTLCLGSGVVSSYEGDALDCGRCDGSGLAATAGLHPDPFLYIPGVEPDHEVDGGLYHQRLLADALGKVLAASGGILDQPLTGPQLLLFANDLEQALRATDVDDRPLCDGCGEYIDQCQCQRPPSSHCICRGNWRSVDCRAHSATMEPAPTSDRWLMPGNPRVQFRQDVREPHTPHILVPLYGKSEGEPDLEVTVHQALELISGLSAAISTFCKRRDVSDALLRSEPADSVPPSPAETER